MAPTDVPVAPDGGTGAAQGEDPGNARGIDWKSIGTQFLMMFIFFNLFSRQQAPQDPDKSAVTHRGSLAGGFEGQEKPQQRLSFRNLFKDVEECDLIVHYSMGRVGPNISVATNDSLAIENGFTPLWRTRVYYEQNAPDFCVNVSLGPFPPSVLSGNMVPYIHAMLVRIPALAETPLENLPEEQVIMESLPLVTKLRQLDVSADATSLFGDEVDAKPKNISAQSVLPYFKTKVDIRPVVDQTVQSMQSLSQGPFRKIKVYPELGVYQPVLYVSDFWLLEKDFVELNETLEGSTLNLTLGYSVASMLAWSMQSQMADQWSNPDSPQASFSITDPQRDSFMLKRLVIDTNPYFLGFSAVFVILHTLFSMLAFKNDIQFWHGNKSMTGLSARSMMISFVCQLITALYLLESQETSKLILFELFLGLALEFWKLKKAVRISIKSSFPFIDFSGQDGYDEKGTDKYDKEAMRYMGMITTPVFIAYTARSAIYDKHRGWYSFLIGTAAGGVYTFGFVTMTPQLYINYKLKSVEHLPWRALTYKAMNTFVDDIFAFLIDMPWMHRISCFRDDIIFFVYLYQRWAYRVDKSRPSMWNEGEVCDNNANAPILTEGNCQSNPSTDVSDQDKTTEPEPGTEINEKNSADCPRGSNADVDGTSL